MPWFSAGLLLSPSQGLCRGLEPGQRSLCSALSDARRRTGSLPAAGISTPGTSQPAGTPCFPLRGQRQRHIANHHRHELRGLSSAARTGHAAGNTRGGFCLLHLHPAHPGMLQGQSGCGRAPSAAAVSPPEGKAARSPLPGPSAMSYRCFRLQPRRGVGRCCRRTQLSSRCSLRGEGASAPAAAPAPRHPLPPRHGPVPRAAFFLLLLLLAIPPARGRQLTPARSDLSCVKRG